MLATPRRPAVRTPPILTKGHVPRMSSIPHGEPLPLRAVLGAGARRVRESAGARQEDVALAAQDYGLPWTRAAVGHMEAGKYRLGVESIALLVGLLATVSRRAVTPADLIDPAAEIAVSPTLTMTGAALVDVLAGRRPAGDQVVRRQPDGRRPAGREIDRRVGRRLGISPDAVARLATQLWGRPFAEIRDAMAAEIDPNASPNRRAGLRGRATTLLVGQMRTALAAPERTAA